MVNRPEGCELFRNDDVGDLTCVIVKVLEDETRKRTNDKQVITINEYELDIYGLEP